MKAPARAPRNSFAPLPWWPPLLALTGLTAGTTLLGLWGTLWWAVLFIDFVLVVIVASRVEPRIGLKRQEAYKRVLAFGFPVMVLVVWELIVGAEILNPRWFPPPSATIRGLWDLTVNYDRFNDSSLIGRPWLIPQRLMTEGWPGVQLLFQESHVFATLSRVLVGFFIGAVPGVLLGMIMGLNRTVRMMLDASMSAVYVLPKIAIFPILMLIFPNPFGEGPKIAVVAISAFFLVAISTMAGVQGIDKVLLQAGRNYGANRWQMLRHVILPGALPIVFSGLRLALGTALIVIVAVEFIRAQRGVGYVIFYHWQILVTEKMYAGLVVVMALGVLLTAALQWLERRVMPWRQQR